MWAKYLLTVLLKAASYGSWYRQQLYQTFRVRSPPMGARVRLLSVPHSGQSPGPGHRRVRRQVLPPQSPVHYKSQSKLATPRTPKQHLCKKAPLSCSTCLNVGTTGGRNPVAEASPSLVTHHLGAPWNIVLISLILACFSMYQYVWYLTSWKSKLVYIHISCQALQEYWALVWPCQRFIHALPCLFHMPLTFPTPKFYTWNPWSVYIFKCIKPMYEHDTLILTLLTGKIERHGIRFQ